MSGECVDIGVDVDEFLLPRGSLKCDGGDLRRCWLHAAADRHERITAIMNVGSGLVQNAEPSLSLIP